MWFRIPTAAMALDNAIAEFGVEHQNAINQITDPHLKGIAVNFLKKNPGATVDDLSAVLNNIKPQSRQPQYAPEELALVNGYEDPTFQKWALIQMRKFKQAQKIENEANPWQIDVQEGLTNIRQLNLLLSQIWDWYRNINPDIASFDFRRALQASNDWHEMMAGRGEGLYYEPTNPKNIVYDFGDGWTMQLVTSPNDLEREGNLMKHCVGGYDRDVINGISRIFSLRDPQNKPKATIEADGDGWRIKQIKGFANGRPDEDVQEMIRDWFDSIGEDIVDDGNIESYYDDNGSGDFYNSEQLNYNTQDVQDLSWLLKGWFDAQINEDNRPVAYGDTYGLKRNTNDFEEISLSEAFDACVGQLNHYIERDNDPKNTNHRWRNYDPEDYDSAVEMLTKTMIEIAFDTDKQTLQEQIDSGEKLKPADVKGGYGSYNYWLERQSLVYELKQLCQGKINDLVKELDVSPEDEQAIQDKAQQLAQEKAKNSIASNDEPFNYTDYNRKIEQYWIKKFGITPEHFGNDRREFMLALQKMYSEYVQELRTEAALDIAVASGEKFYAQELATYDLAKQISNEIPKYEPAINQLLSEATTGVKSIENPVEPIDMKEQVPQDLNKEFAY